MSTLTPTSTGARVPRVVVESLLLAGRGLRHVRQVPERLIDVTIQPVLFVFLFAYVFGSAIGVPGGGNYREYLVSGMLAQTITFCAASMSLGVSTDMQEGVIDRFRSLPISRGAVLGGRILAELAQTVLGIVVTAGTGLLIGWGIHTGVMKALECFGLLLFFTFAMSWIGAFAGLKIRSPEAAQGVFFMTIFPLTFASGIFVPTAGMTPWLRHFADWNPVSSLATSIRTLFGNPTGLGPHPVWPQQHATLLALLWSASIFAVFAPLAIRAYARKVSK